MAKTKNWRHYQRILQSRKITKDLAKENKITILLICVNFLVNMIAKSLFACPRKKWPFWRVSSYLANHSNLKSFQNALIGCFFA